MTLALHDETADITDETLPVADEAITAPALPVAEDSPEGDTPDATDDGQPTTPADGVTAQDAPPESSAPAPAPEPFLLKAHGKTAKLDGAVIVPGEGLRIPEGAAMQRAQQLMARGIEMETYGRQRIRELEVTTEALQREQSEAEVHAGAIIAWFNEVTASQDSMIDVLTNWAQHRPLFDVRVEKAKFEHEKRRSEWQRQAQQPSPQEQAQQLLEQAKQMGTEVLSEEATKHGLSKADADAIAARLLRRPELYLVQGPQGVQFDDVALAADVAAEAADRKARRTQVTAVERAATRNAKVQAGTIPVAAKAPAGTVTPRQPRDAQTGQFKTREEWEAHMRGD